MSEKISHHFKRSEFGCKCNKCKRDCVDIELLSILEDLHMQLQSEYLGNRVCIEIDSANRCAIHNAQVGGAPTSQHLLGKAADIRCWLVWHKKQIDPDEVANYLDRAYPDQFGLGRYDTFTHIDVRPVKARWNLKTGKEGA